MTSGKPLRNVWVDAMEELDRTVEEFGGDVELAIHTMERRQDARREWEREEIEKRTRKLRRRSFWRGFCNPFIMSERNMAKALADATKLVDEVRTEGQQKFGSKGRS